MSASEIESDEESETKTINFHELELDDRILKVKNRADKSLMNVEVIFWHN